MSLLDTYDLVDKAEKLASQHRFKDASELYTEASKSFGKLVSSTDNKEIQSALSILSDQHAKRSDELKILERSKAKLPSPVTSALPQMTAARTRYGQSSISSSLASARGGASNPATSTANLSETAILDPNTSGDPVMRFQVAVYNLIRAPHLNTGDVSMPSKPLKSSGKSVEELELENATLKQLLTTYSENLQNYESFHKKVKQSLKSYLSTLKRDLQQQEQEKKQEYEAKIEQMYKDNKKLEQQTNKLKQRWNELVESAKKRREETKTSSSDAS